MEISAEINKHDFRGYYGLGHTYEILRMPFLAIHYYKQAHIHRLVAMVSTECVGWISDSQWHIPLMICYVQHMNAVLFVQII